MLLKITVIILLAALASFNFSEAAQTNGPDIAKAITNSYNSTPADCGSSAQPAYLCSGVFIRGTDVYSDQYHTWDPSPASQESGGVSFSWLRKDAKFNKLAYSYNNGYIFYPFMNAPADKTTSIDVLCIWPIDAASEYRSDSGCGPSSQYPTQSGPCQQQNIFTAEQWYDHYLEGGRSHLYQCGFETRSNSVYDRADGYYQAIRSMALISDESFNEQNELRLATWAQGMQRTLPIEAFFYISGTSGLSSAQNNQLDLLRSTDNAVWVPVIELKLPASPAEEAQFIFNDDDQAVHMH
ncbi:MAG TPA: HvnC protein [Franconibacter pulveris]|nr:HvnC protein [Franconibacter pulveris]